MHNRHIERIGQARAGQGDVGCDHRPSAEESMEYTRLGSSGLQVSRICLGCMSYGEPGRGDQSWSIDEEASRPFFKQALDAGVTFFDTANVYSAGSSEGITGRLLLSLTRRDEVVIATKVQQRMG